jgi:hypothetical protein
MRISARVYLQSILLVGITAGLLAPNATAGSLTISFAGYVNGTGPGATFPTGLAVGDKIAGSFTFNASKSASSQGVYQFGGAAPAPALLFAIPYPLSNPTNQFGDSYSTGLNPNTFTITISYVGTTATFDVHANTTGAGYTKTGGAFVDIKFTSTTYTGYALPQTLAAFNAAFATTTAKFIWDPGDPGVGGTITNINGLSVPEPSSLTLLTVATGVGGIGLMISRRKFARAS